MTLSFCQNLSNRSTSFPPTTEQPSWLPSMNNVRMMFVVSSCVELLHDSDDGAHPEGESEHRPGSVCTKCQRRRRGKSHLEHSSEFASAPVCSLDGDVRKRH